MVGNFKRGREESRRENCLDGFSSLRRAGKRSRQSSACRRKWQQTQRDLRDNAEHSFRTDKEANQVEPGFVFVNAAAGPQHFPIRQHYLKPNHVITGHAILQAARTASVCCDIAADSAILHACRVRRIKQFLRFGRRFQVGRDYARFDNRNRIAKTNLRDAVHPHQ